jgi:CBS domain-containing protein
MRVRDVMTREVRTVGPEETLREVARALRDDGISSVVVTEGGAPVGIVTERDVVHLVAEGVDPGSAQAGERMTRELVTVAPRADLTEAAELMAEHGIRHLPVLERGRLAGILSIRDVTNWAVDEMGGTSELVDFERSSAALSAAARAKRKR